MASKKKNKTYQDRLDPGHKLGDELSQAQVLTKRPFSWLMRLFGFKREQLQQIEELHREYEMLVDLAWVADALNPLGWSVLGAAPADEYSAAAVLARDGKPEEANALLLDAWNGGDLLKFGILRVYSLYAHLEEGPQEEHDRRRLLEKALVHHKNGAYEASVPIVLAQIDGITREATGREAKDFFRARRKHLVDDETLAGHPKGLANLSEMFVSKDREGNNGELHRHTIMHGTNLRYDTLENSTKAFVALFAVIEWAAARNRSAVQDGVRA